MSQWHLDTLRNALLAKGWRIVAVHSDGMEWDIQRSTAIAPLVLQMDPLDAMGRDIPVEKSYGCSIKGHQKTGLYFYRTKTFPPALNEFISKLDELEGSLRREARNAHVT